MAQEQRGYCTGFQLRRRQLPAAVLLIRRAECTSVRLLAPVWGSTYGPLFEVGVVSAAPGDGRGGLFALLRCVVYLAPFAVWGVILGFKGDALADALALRSIDLRGDVRYLNDTAGGWLLACMQFRFWGWVLWVVLVSKLGKRRNCVLGLLSRSRPQPNLPT